jgi:hypothetical protein
MTLGFNVSGGLVNLSQVPLIVMPYLGGKYGYGATMTAMRQAIKEIQAGGKLLSKKTRTIETVGTDENGNLITETREVPAGYSAENTKASGFFLFHGERMNREVSLIAAFKLAMGHQRYGDDERWSCRRGYPSTRTERCR